MKIITTLTDDNDNVLARVETKCTDVSDMDAHEGELYKIERKIEDTIEASIENPNIERAELIKSVESGTATEDELEIYRQMVEDEHYKHGEQE